MVDQLDDPRSPDIRAHSMAIPEYGVEAVGTSMLTEIEA